MAKAKFTTAIEEDILKKMKIRAIEEEMNVGELIEKSFTFYSKQNKLTKQNSNIEIVEKLEIIDDHVYEVALDIWDSFLESEEHKKSLQVFVKKHLNNKNLDVVLNDKKVKEE